MDIIESMKKEMLRRKYSEKTIKTYSHCVINFLNYNKKEKFTKYDALDYLNKLAEKNVSGSTMNVYLQSIKFMMEEILHKRRTFYNVKFTKTPKSLPEVLSQGEIVRLMESINNNKHRLAITLMYSAGLRVSELVHLNVKDLEFDKNYGWVRHGKGNKDRLFIIADNLKNDLQEHIKENKLDENSFLFKGYKEHHLSQKSIHMIVKRAAKKAGIHKNVHSHTLRHSYATHLIENGYGLSDVQSLLGHKSPETTTIYVHIASPKMISVKSPLDCLNYNPKGGMKQ